MGDVFRRARAVSLMPECKSIQAEGALIWTHGERDSMHGRIQTRTCTRGRIASLQAGRRRKECDEKLSLPSVPRIQHDAHVFRTTWVQLHGSWQALRQHPPDASAQQELQHFSAFVSSFSMVRAVHLAQSQLWKVLACRIPNGTK